jgi:hypothetical protein
MVTKAKVSRNVNPRIAISTVDEEAVNEVINRGGKTTGENAVAPEVDSETRFTLRIPQKLIDLIDQHRMKRVGNISRNQWIVEAIAEKIESK